MPQPATFRPCAPARPYPFIGPVVAITVMVGASAKPGNASQGIGQKVTVYVQNDAGVPSPLLSRARTLAVDMFAGIGVQINWRAGARLDAQLVREHAIAVRLTLENPQGFKSSVGAFTAPTEGVHITVLYNRLTWSLAKPGLAPALLAHVLVHEITHILEGVPRHSETGIMKPNWTSSDYYEMETKTLPFASEDIELTHHGLAQRFSESAAPLANARSDAAAAR